MNRRELPYTTVTEGISVFDKDNQYRERAWLDLKSEEIDWTYKENDSVLLSILEQLPTAQAKPITSPIVSFTEDTRLESATTLNSAMAAGDTYLDLVDPYIAVINSELVFPDTAEVVQVRDVDYDKSESWTTEGGGASANVRVYRSKGSTAAIAQAVGKYVIAMPAFMAEKSDLRGGVGRTPGESMHNYISLVSAKTSTSVMQEGSEVKGNWGKLGKATQDMMFDLRQRLQYALLFQTRRTELTANEGQLYIGDGALPQIGDGFLDLGTYTPNATWEVLNSYLEKRFEPDASSQTKVLIAGPGLYSMFLTLARAVGRVEAGQPYYDTKIGGFTFQLSTEGGYVVSVIRDRWGLSPHYGLTNWGFLFDMANINYCYYNGLQFKLYQNLQDRASVLIREDGFMGSFCLILRQRLTHGVIRGQQYQLVER